MELVEGQTLSELLTGRREFFRTLRQYQGCSGFLSRQESERNNFV